MRKHRLAERLLVDVIGLDWEDVHIEACRWEHVMSEAVERRILALLDKPLVCPHGNPIPGLDELGLPFGTAERGRPADRACPTAGRPGRAHASSSTASASSCSPTPTLMHRLTDGRHAAGQIVTVTAGAGGVRGVGRRRRAHRVRAAHQRPRLRPRHLTTPPTPARHGCVSRAAHRAAACLDRQRRSVH